LPSERYVDIALTPVTNVDITYDLGKSLQKVQLWLAYSGHLLSHNEAVGL